MWTGRYLRTSWPVRLGNSGRPDRQNQRGSSRAAPGDQDPARVALEFLSFGGTHRSCATATLHSDIVTPPPFVEALPAAKCVTISFNMAGSREVVCVQGLGFVGFAM